jgi:hypothetical protein
MNISFLDFWNDFSQENNFITHLIRSIKFDIKVVEPSKADIIIFSCFGSENKKYNHCKKIFYTGENIRPNLSDCDYSITFDLDDYGGRNIRIPLWYFYIDWFSVKTYGNPNYLIPVEYLYGGNEFTKKDKSKFCSTVFSRPEQLRFSTMNQISSYKSVDGYGKVHSRNLPDGEKLKLDIISDYKFNICFENSVYPGYFTEKLLHSKIAGCIPIYYSDKTFSEDFNDKCCLNYINYNNVEDLLEDIKRIDNDNTLYKQILNEPLFIEKINLENLTNKIYQILKKN